MFFFPITFILFSSSLQSDSLCGPKFVCVQIDKYAPITEDQLYEYTTKKFGRVLNCVLYNTRGYAFIEFDQLINAHRALASNYNRINGFDIQYCPRHDSSKILPLLPLILFSSFTKFYNSSKLLWTNVYSWFI